MLQDHLAVSETAGSILACPYTDELNVLLISVPHTSEIPYVFGISNGNNTFSAIMQDYWISFATSLDPNDGRGHKRNVFYTTILSAIFF